MNSATKRLRKLTLFFWIVVGFNFLEDIPCFFYNVGVWKFATASEVGRSILFALTLFLWPWLLLFSAQLLIRKHYPNRAIDGWRRGGYNFVVLLQFIFAIWWTLVFLFLIRSEMTKLDGISSNEILKLPFYFIWYWICFITSIWNLAASVIFWRTIWTIRRSFRESLIDSFETI
jgi:hypothetical protein